MLAFTNTMVMIITADEESSRVVTTMPTSKLLKVVEVKRFIQLFALLPVASCSVFDKLFTANKNSTKPAIIDNIISVIKKKLLATNVALAAN
jgi:hypothetical protein